MPKFNFVDHRINERRWNYNGETVKSRTMELYGAECAAGKQDQAIFIFDSALDKPRVGPAVGYATNNDGEGISIVGWFPLDAFDRYNKILASGEDLSVHFELRDAGTGSGYLRRLGIGLAEEILAAEGGNLPVPANNPAPAFAMPL